ncbi:hypothetical protein BSKO_05621 [Bryopsis sp. KO-2023]|nr:hypothetical protein BSKO_05621 [Bryopsis sp. KO-2023]
MNLISRVEVQGTGFGHFPKDKEVQVSKGGADIMVEKVLSGFDVADEGALAMLIPASPTWVANFEDLYCLILARCYAEPRLKKSGE